MPKGGQPKPPPKAEPRNRSDKHQAKNEIWSLIDHQQVRDRLYPHRERVSEELVADRQHSLPAKELVRRALERVEQALETVLHAYRRTWKEQGFQESPEFFEVVYGRGLQRVVLNHQKLLRDSLEHCGLSIGMEDDPMLEFRVGANRILNRLWASLRVRSRRLQYPKQKLNGSLSENAGRLRKGKGGSQIQKESAQIEGKPVSDSPARPVSESGKATGSGPMNPTVGWQHVEKLTALKVESFLARLDRHMESVIAREGYRGVNERGLRLLVAETRDLVRVWERCYREATQELGFRFTAEGICLLKARLLALVAEEESGRRRYVAKSPIGGLRDRMDQWLSKELESTRTELECRLDAEALKLQVGPHLQNQSRALGSSTDEQFSQHRQAAIRRVQRHQAVEKHTAAACLGITTRQVNNLLQQGKLERAGEGRNQKVVSSSILRYGAIPPEPDAEKGPPPKENRN